MAKSQRVRPREPGASPSHENDRGLTPLAGQITAVDAIGTARFVDTRGREIPCRCPQHVDVAWLRAAVARAPVDAEIAAAADLSRGSVWCLFPGPAHAGVAVDSLELRAGKSIRLSCGDATLTLASEGRARLRAREVSVRGSRTARLSGGTVKIN